MVSIREFAEDCLGLSGNISIVRDFLGYQNIPNATSLIEYINLLRNNHIRVHIKIVNNNIPPPNRSIDNMIDSMRRVYANSSIGIAIMSWENLVIPSNFNDIEVTESDTLDELFSNRNNVENNEIVAYFVSSVLLNGDTQNGFAPSHSTLSVLVSSGASLWTLGHEFGHVLIGPHSENRDLGFCPTDDLDPANDVQCLLGRLMTCCGTFMIPVTTTPIFSNSETQDILNSGLTFTC